MQTIYKWITRFMFEHVPQEKEIGSAVSAFFHYWIDIIISRMLILEAYRIFLLIRIFIERYRLTKEVTLRTNYICHHLGIANV